MKRLLAPLTLLILLYACQPDDDNQQPETPATSALTKSYSGDFLHDYFTLQCDIVRTTPGYLPTIAARAYGYLGIAAYESVVYGIPGAQSLAGQVGGIDSGSLPKPVSGEIYNWALVCNSASAAMMRHMFGGNLTDENRARIDMRELDNLANLGYNVSPEIQDRSVAYGVALAEALYQISTTDGGHESYLDPWQSPFTWVEADYCWIPTGAQDLPLSPKWQYNRSFLSDIAARTQPGAHIPFSSDPTSDFFAEAMDVYNQVNNNVEEEITIAKYWADDPFTTCTPAGHTFNILKQLLSESSATLEKSAVAMAMMGVAENDAFISCWKSKYDYMLIRPVSYIKLYIDSEFETVIGTPPFPAYTSGHSTEIGAGTKIMAHLFANNSSGDYTFTDLSQMQYGFQARTFDNFYTMAEECALSRYYAGIHYTMDNAVGLDMDYAVGEAVLNEINWPQNIE